MIKTFILSFKLRNTYKTNTIIYSIKQLPIIKKILPNSLYKNKGLKILANIISIILELGSIFLGKFLYILTMIFSFLNIYKTNTPDTFVHFITFLTIAGAFINTYMFNPTKDKYYAMFIMRMNSKEYTLSNYWYSITKIILGFMPFTIIFGMMAKLNIWLCILIPFFIASIKIIISAYYLKNYEKNNIVINENTPAKFTWGIITICIILAYGLPYINITINTTIFLILSIISIIIGIFSIIYINKFNKYREMYKNILTNSTIDTKEVVKQITKDSVLNQIEISENITSNKKGYHYFNDLFIKRHSKILIKSIKKLSYVLLFIIIGLIIIVLTTNDTKINELIMTYLPYFVFIMYLINRSQTVTQAMFMNCDHSMLTYSFYKTPKAILSLFKERIKSVVIINLFPAIIIGLGLAILLYITGGTNNPYNYLIIIISILSMSIFFSIHHLVMYYLLQPYNIDSETKSSTYSVVNFITYFACYYMIKLQIPTTYFGLATILFTITYCIISLILVYKLAPKTFRLKI